MRSEILRVALQTQLPMETAVPAAPDVGSVLERDDLLHHKS